MRPLLATIGITVCFYVIITTAPKWNRLMATQPRPPLPKQRRSTSTPISTLLPT